MTRKPRDIDFSAFDRGEPIRIDLRVIPLSTARKRMRKFLAEKRYYNPHLVVERNINTDLGQWLVCDWRDTRTKHERLKDHPFYKFFSHGILYVTMRPWETETAIKQRFREYLKKLYCLGIPFIASKRTYPYNDPVMIFHNPSFEVEETKD